ncbi:MAG: 2-succinyl-5-enolpyruvyl-6-hydroxy-3-cyclohexene-1-carboxylic-acid synthase, partial [Mammaliicoccus vitulinus]
DLDYQHVAHLYELGYEKFEDVSDYKRQTLPQFGSYLYEIMTNREENTETHRELFAKMKGIQYVNSPR